MTSPSVKLLRTQSDDRLVALAAAGHERAFEAIVERYRRQLLRHSRRYLPEARAEDAVQQALVSAWSALRRGDDVRELRPWLHRIVHNSALNTLRTAGYDYEQLHDTLHGAGGPAELAERRAVVRQTLAGLAALPERQRQQRRRKRRRQRGVRRGARTGRSRRLVRLRLRRPARADRR
jgi:RNA polymerase sigma factor (sigma-70 family)